VTLRIVLRLELSSLRRVINLIVDLGEAMMARRSGRGLCIIGLFACLSATSAWAGESSDVRALIERQLDAFAHDDAAAAYSYAAPGLKIVFTDPDNFMAMVRNRYQPVYRHRSVEFGKMDINGDNAQQIVTIVDNDSIVWKALYTLARQPGGAWLINGCVLIKSTDSAT
jgi:hypothetical protein